MNEDSLDGLESSARSRNFYPGYLEDPALLALLSKKEWQDGLYSNMFQDDFSRVMPRTYQNDHSFVARAPDQAAEDLITRALPSRYGSNRDLSDALCDFVDDVVSQLLGDFVYFELEFFRPSHDAVPVAFKFRPIPSGSVRMVRRRLIQFVPHDDSLPQIQGVSFLTLDANSIAAFDLPTRTRRLIDRAHRLWGAADRTSDEAVNIITAGQQLGFDFELQRREIARYILRQTRELGWDGRGLLTDEALDPLKASMRLNFVRLQIRTRDHVLQKLTSALANAGTTLGVDLTLRLEGLTTEEDVEAAEVALRNGERRITDIILFHP